MHTFKRKTVDHQATVQFFSVFSLAQVKLGIAFLSISAWFSYLQCFFWDFSHWAQFLRMKFILTNQWTERRVLNDDVDFLRCFTISIYLTFYGWPSFWIMPITASYTMTKSAVFTMIMLSITWTCRFFVQNIWGYWSYIMIKFSEKTKHNILTSSHTHQK